MSSVDDEGENNNAESEVRTGTEEGVPRLCQPHGSSHARSRNRRATGSFLLGSPRMPRRIARGRLVSGRTRTLRPLNAGRFELRGLARATSVECQAAAARKKDFQGAKSRRRVGYRAT